MRTCGKTTTKKEMLLQKWCMCPISSCKLPTSQQFDCLLENHLEWCWVRPQEWVKVAHDFFCRQLLKMVPSRLLEKALEGMRRLQASIVEICPRVTLQSIRKLDHYTSELKTWMNSLTMWMKTISWMDFSKNGSNNSGTNCCYVAPF